MSIADSTVIPGLRRAVGLADLCELLAATFAFPDNGRLAVALASGDYLSDALGCLADAGFTGSAARDMCRELKVFIGRGEAELAQNLRRGHSLLFLSPAHGGPIWPYEGAFRFASTGTSETPSLFRSPVTLQVERDMSEAGLLPTTARTEPIDSVWGELGFLSRLYGHQAQELARGRDDPGEGAAWARRAASFTREHTALWLPDFMEHVRCRAESGDLPHGTEYAALARFGGAAVRVLADGNAP